MVVDRRRQQVLLRFCIYYYSKIGLEAAATNASCCCHCALPPPLQFRLSCFERAAELNGCCCSSNRRSIFSFELMQSEIPAAAVCLHCNGHLFELTLIFVPCGRRGGVSIDRGFSEWFSGGFPLLSSTSNLDGAGHRMTDGKKLAKHHLSSYSSSSVKCPSST